MRKVAFFITGLNFGGAELALLRLLSANEYQPIVFSLKSDGQLKSHYESNGVRVIDLGLKVWNFRRNLQLVLKKLDENEIEIICSWLYHADFFTSFLRILRPNLKLVWTVHNLSVGKQSIRTATRIIVYTNSLISYAFPHKIIYCASSAKNYHENSLNYNKRIGVEINNPIIYDKDLKVLHSKTIKKANKFTVGMAARWDPVKNHQLAFEAFAGFQLIEPNSEFVLCGSGINWENKSLVNMLNKFQIVDKVKLLDILTEMDTFYNAVDILLITSYSEALPNIVVEALLYETPIVSVPAGDIPKILDDLGMLVSYEPH